MNLHLMILLHKRRVDKSILFLDKTMAGPLAHSEVSLMTFKEGKVDVIVL